MEMKELYFLLIGIIVMPILAYMRNKPIEKQRKELENKMDTTQFARYAEYRKNS